MKDPRQGRKWTRLAKWIIQRDRGICWRCGHEGADTAGHILPWKSHPHLAFDPNNLRAEHGMKRPEYECIGNYAAKDNAGHTNANPVRRQWL